MECVLTLSLLIHDFRKFEAMFKRMCWLFLSNFLYLREQLLHQKSEKKYLVPNIIPSGNKLIVKMETKNKTVLAIVIIIMNTIINHHYQSSLSITISIIITIHWLLIHYKNKIVQYHFCKVCFTVSQLIRCMFKHYKCNSLQY